MKYRSVEQILREHIAEIKDFPSPGIIFRDLTPILADSKIFTLAIDELYLYVPVVNIEVGGTTSLAVQAVSVAVGNDGINTQYRLIGH